MTQPPAVAPADDRPYSPGLEGVVAGETALSFIDGAAGRLLYRGYPIGELVREGSYAARRRAAVDGRLGARTRSSPAAPVPGPVLTALRALPTTAKPMDALRTAVSAWGATESLGWPPTRGRGPRADRVLAVRAGGVRADPARAKSRSRPTPTSTSCPATCT